MTDHAAGGGRGWGWDFIDLAALGRNTPRSYAVTLLCVILLPLTFLMLAFVAIWFAAARHLLPPAGVSSAVLGAAFGAMVVAGVALAWRVARSHRRPWMSLISADLVLDWRRLAIGAGVESVLALALLAVAHSAVDKPARTGLTVTLPAAALALLLTPFQAASEEMLFRGYLTQALGRLVRSRGAIVLTVGVLFGALHFNAYGGLTLPYLLILSLIFSLTSLRDGRLELAIGAHAANNGLAICAAYALGASPTDMKINLAALGVLAANGALFYGLTRFLVRLFCEPRLAS